MVVLVTGPIGSGKSVVCRLLQEAGFPVYDSDSRTKALYDSVPGLIAKVEDAIGVPFSEVGIIFTNPLKREALEAVVYPYVLNDFRKWCESQDSSTVIMESAIALSKRQFDGLFDKVVLVRAASDTRACRNPKASLRDSSQEQIDASLADFVIDNNGSLEELENKVKSLIETI